MSPIRKLINPTTCILLIIAPLAAYALTQDSEQPMQIKADSTLFNYKSGVDNYEGHVIIHQGSTLLTSERLVTKKNAQHKLDEATAYGLKGFAEYTTVPNTGDRVLHAKAKTIHFYPLKSIVVLEDQVSVTQGENSFQGAMIIYNIKDQTVTAPATKFGRTTIIIEPKQLT